MAFGATSYQNSNTTAQPRVDTTFLTADDFLVQRDILKEVEDTWDEKNFASLLQLTDRVLVAKNNTFYHYENGLLYRSIGIATVKAGSTAGTATVTLTADSYTNIGGQNRSPLKATDQVMIAPGVWAYCTVKTSSNPSSGSAMIGTAEDNGTPTGTATEYTFIRRNGSSDDLAAMFTALVASGKRVSIPSNAHAEGSYQPTEGLDNNSTRYQGQMQIFKQHKAITGTADGFMLEASVGGKTYKWNKYVPELLLKHNMDINFTHLYSPGGSYTSGGKTIKLTTGLEGYVKAQGLNYAYDLATGFDLADLDAIVAKLKAIWGAKEYFWVMGSTLRGQVEEAIRTFTTNGGIVYNSFGKGDSAKKMIDLGINSFAYKGIVFHMQETGAFNHPEVTGLENFNYDKVGFLIPGDKQKITFSQDGETKSMNVSSAAIRYLRQSNGVDRRMKQWDNDVTNNGGRDERSLDILSEEGLQLTGLRKFIRVYAE